MPITNAKITGYSLNVKGARECERDPHSCPTLFNPPPALPVLLVFLGTCLWLLSLFNYTMAAAAAATATAAAVCERHTLPLATYFTIDAKTYSAAGAAQLGTHGCRERRRRVGTPACELRRTW